MKPLFDINTINDFKSFEKLPFKCELCDATFFIDAKFVKSNLKHIKNRHRFCSVNCFSLHQDKRINTNCAQCNKDIIVESFEIKRSKSGNSFCSRSCAATYNNTHKTTGCRRSKLEMWIESSLKDIYPNLEIDFNKKDTINSELDIYIPSLRLAFELNGIFHYEPIYSVDKLASIQNNDKRKFQACLEKNIELVIIDSSSLIHFKPIKSKRYLDIITDIINFKLVGLEEFESSCPFGK